MDSGGTSTETFALDVDGNILYHLISGCGSPAASYTYAINNIYNSIDEVYEYMQKNNNKLMFIELGISGLGAVENVKGIEKEFSDKYQAPCEIVTDAHIALMRICDLYNVSDAICLVAGTGNACLGIKNNEFHLTGGGGPLLAEAGSAYSFTHRLALRIKDNYEKGLPYTTLQQKCLSYFNCDDFPALKTYFYRHTKEEVASFTKHGVSLKNDEVNELIKEQAQELFNQVILQYTYFKFENKVILGLLGGFFHHNDLLVDEIKKLIEINHLNIELVTKIDKVYLGALNRAKTLLRMKKANENK